MTFAISSGSNPSSLGPISAFTHLHLWYLLAVRLSPVMASLCPQVKKQIMIYKGIRYGQCPFLTIHAITPLGLFSFSFSCWHFNVKKMPEEICTLFRMKKVF
jgi:hypothetical protein